MHAVKESDYQSHVPSRFLFSVKLSQAGQSRRTNTDRNLIETSVTIKLVWGFAKLLLYPDCGQRGHGAVSLHGCCSHPAAQDRLRAWDGNHTQHIYKS